MRRNSWNHDAFFWRRRGLINTERSDIVQNTAVDIIVYGTETYIDIIVNQNTGIFHVEKGYPAGIEMEAIYSRVKPATQNLRCGYFFIRVSHV